MPMNARLLRPLASGFNPRSISGLIGWWDASDASTLAQNSDGTTAVSATDDPVAYWKNKAGTTNAIQTDNNNRPFYKSSSLNGKGTLFFDGSNDKLIAGIDLPQPFTVFGVHRLNSGTGNAGSALGNLQNSGSFDGFLHSLFQQNTTQVSSAVRTGGVGTETARSTVGTDWYLLVSSIDGKLAIRANKGEPAEATVAYNARDTQITLGASRTGEGSNSMRAHWTAELLIYSRSLSAAEIRRVENYLAQKWGVA